MLKGRRFISMGITHGAALLIGLGAWTTLRNFQAPETGRSEQNTKSSRPRPDGPKSVDEVLSLISADNSETPEKKWEKMRTSARAEFEELVKTMSVPDDLEAALSAELAKWDPEKSPASGRIGALMYFWAIKDLPGLLKWTEGKFDTPKTAAWNTYTPAIIATVLKEKGPDDLLSILGDPSLADRIREDVACAMAATPDLEQLARLKEKTTPREWEKLKDPLCTNWPWSEKSKFVEFAVSEDRPQWIVTLAQSQKEKSEAGTWLLDLMKDGSLDPEFRNRLFQDKELRYIALSNPDLPLDERLRMINLVNANQAGNLSPTDQLARRDLDHVFANVRDWNAEFRSGSANADDVLAGVSKELPELAAKSPAEIRNAVFLDLAEDDPVRSLPLLDGLSAADRTAAMVSAAQNGFFRVDPDHFLTFLQQIPAEDPQLQEARLQAWEKHALDGYTWQNMDYVAWVRALPDGMDREMAIYSLSLATAENQPELATQLRSELKDDNLRKKAQ